MVASVKFLNRPHQVVGVQTHSTHQIDPDGVAVAIRNPHLPNEVYEQPSEGGTGRRHDPEVLDVSSVGQDLADSDLVGKEIDCSVHDKWHLEASAEVPDFRDLVVVDESTRLSDTREESRVHEDNTSVVHSRGALPHYANPTASCVAPSSLCWETKTTSLPDHLHLYDFLARSLLLCMPACRGRLYITRFALGKRTFY